MKCDEPSNFKRKVCTYAITLPLEVESLSIFIFVAFNFL